MRLSKELNNTTLTYGQVEKNALHFSDMIRFWRISQMQIIWKENWHDSTGKQIESR